METVSERLKRIRKAKGLSQKKISELCGIEQSSYSLIENGKQTSISVETGRKLCNALDVSFFELFDIPSPSNHKAKDLEIEISKLKKELNDKIKIVDLLESEKSNLKDFFVMQFVSSYQYNIGFLNDLIDESTNEDFKMKMKNKRLKFIEFEKKTQKQYIDMKLFSKEDITSYVNEMKEMGIPFFDINDL